MSRSDRPHRERTSSLDAGRPISAGGRSARIVRSADPAATSTWSTRAKAFVKDSRGGPLPMDGRRPIQRRLVSSYNVEVERHHNDLVGRDRWSSPLAHNGTPGPGG